jgi:hypothetical protein
VAAGDNPERIRTEAAWPTYAESHPYQRVQARRPGIG